MTHLSLFSSSPLISLHPCFPIPPPLPIFPSLPPSPPVYFHVSLSFCLHTLPPTLLSTLCGSDMALSCCCRYNPPTTSAETQIQPHGTKGEEEEAVVQVWNRAATSTLQANIRNTGNLMLYVQLPSALRTFNTFQLFVLAL